MSVLTAALACAQLGWPVVPVCAPEGDTCDEPSHQHPTCSRPGKRPRRPRWQDEATTDADEITEIVERWPEGNLGVVTGTVHVLDVDGDLGFETLEDLVAQHGPLPEGPVSHTGSGGAHYWFAAPPVRLGNRAGFAPGLDWRGVGGLVIAPPSRHHSGGQYEWVHPGPNVPLPPPPGWLLNLVAPPPPERRRPLRAVQHLTPWVSKALKEECARVGRAPEGTRNHTLNRAAFKVGQLVGMGFLDPETAVEQLTVAALRAGLERKETADTIASGLTSGAKHPRQVRP